MWALKGGYLQNWKKGQKRGPKNGPVSLNVHIFDFPRFRQKNDFFWYQKKSVQKVLLEHIVKCADPKKGSKTGFSRFLTPWSTDRPEVSSLLYARLSKSTKKSILGSEKKSKKGEKTGFLTPQKSSGALFSQNATRSMKCSWNIQYTALPYTVPNDRFGPPPEGVQKVDFGGQKPWISRIGISGFWTLWSKPGDPKSRLNVSL